MGPNGQQPIFILREGTDRKHGRVAQSNNIAAARAVADAVRTTLGPKGMDKMLVDESGDVIITNDGATILREMNIDHPAAKMIIEVSKTQEQECFDGTTTAVVLSGELLKQAEELLGQGIHPTTICDIYRTVGSEAVNALSGFSKATKDNTLLSVARTALTGKSSGDLKEHLASICVEAVRRLNAESGTINLDDIMVVKALGGEATDSSLIESIVLDKERAHPSMPKTILNANGAICVLSCPLTVQTTTMDANIQITDPTQIAAFLEQEEASLREMVEKIASSGATVVVCQKEIDDLAKHYLAKEQILAVEKVKKSDIEALSRVTGAAILGNLDDLDTAALGSCDNVVEQRVGELPMVFFDGYESKPPVTLMLRGGTAPFIEEVERAFDDAVGVVKVAYEDGRVVPGGGSVFAALAQSILTGANDKIGRERMAAEAVADALLVIPRTLVENAGLDPVDEIMTLRSAHNEGKATWGVDVFAGGLVDMAESDVWEPLRVVSQAIKSAIETSIMILRIDDVISSKKA